MITTRIKYGKDGKVDGPVIIDVPHFATLSELVIAGKASKEETESVACLVDLLCKELEAQDSITISAIK